MGPETGRLDIAWRMAVLGLGLGPLQSLFGIAIQNAVPMNRIGVVTSANQFFRQIGATLATGVFGTLMSSYLAHHLLGNLGSAASPTLAGLLTQYTGNRQYSIYLVLVMLVISIIVLMATTIRKAKTP